MEARKRRRMGSKDWMALPFEFWGSLVGREFDWSAAAKSKPAIEQYVMQMYWINARLDWDGLGSNQELLRPIESFVLTGEIGIQVKTHTMWLDYY